MNRLFALLVALSIFSVAQEDVKNLEGTFSSETLAKGINLSTEVLNSWFGTDMKVVEYDLNTTEPLLSLIENELKKEEKIAISKRKLTVELDSSCITENGKKIYNAKAGVRYTFKSGIGVETGYKVIRLNFDEISDLTSKTDSLGLYGRLVMAF